MTMKLLGVDYGTKRVGLAVSDEDGTMAFPKSVVPNTADLHTVLWRIADEVGTTHIVIGESKNLKGENNPLMGGITRLKNSLEGLGLVVSLEPEYMTTQQAERLQDKSDQLDASAAAIILQSYLDRQA